MQTTVNESHIKLEDALSNWKRKVFNEGVPKGLLLDSHPDSTQDPVFWSNYSSKVLSETLIGEFRVFIVEQTLEGHFANRVDGAPWDYSNQALSSDSNDCYPAHDRPTTFTYYIGVGLLKSDDVPARIKRYLGDTFPVTSDYWRKNVSIEAVGHRVKQRAIEETDRLKENNFNIKWYATALELSKGLLYHAAPFYTSTKTGFPAEVNSAGSNPLVSMRVTNRKLEVGEIVRFHSNSYRYGIITKVGKSNCRIAYVTKTSPNHVTFATRNILSVEVEEGWKHIAKEIA
jgi:hypothetical protein